MKRMVFVLLLIGVLAVAACGAKATATPEVGMPNPASVFCEENGYRLEIRTAADGSQQGFCIFPDGTECDEWAFFRGECAPGTPKP
jgi:putative hemolysin